MPLSSALEFSGVVAAGVIMAVDYQKEGRIAVFTINRPDVMNAINADVSQEMNEAMIDFRDDSELWVGIITGAGEKSFSAGADITGFRPGPATARQGTAERVRADQIWKPFIAAINGYALGGGLELAMTCDIRIAAEHASLGLPEVTIGFMPGGGGTQRLPRFIPRAKAAEMLLMGQRIDAQEAYRIGLVNKVVPLDRLMPAAREWAETICRAGPLGVRAVKEAMIKGYSLPLEEGLLLERDLANHIRTTADFMEGARAFIERRPPKYEAK
ncbi:MAG: enoyl-CoA hydratase-related protein [Dehalococcoidales bacterium]|nr:enoyl-CoA hydratase-related protein [Dehalococcoidales bacterium]